MNVMLGTLATACCVVAVLAQAPQTPAPTPQQPSEIQLVISGEPGTPPRYAVPDFVALSPDVADAAKMLGQVLWDDLNFEREFYMIPRDTYTTIPVARTAEEVPFNAWRELGADAVVFGTVQKADANTVRDRRRRRGSTRTRCPTKSISSSARCAALLGRSWRLPRTATAKKSQGPSRIAT